MFRIVISVKYTNCDINILKIAAFFREEVKKLYCPYMDIPDHVFIMTSGVVFIQRLRCFKNFS